MPQSSQTYTSFPLHTVSQVKAGKYSIGSNGIPNASPPHQRELRSYWIDRMPVTFGHFERFVAGGGYDDASLWTDTLESPSISSIDQRCDELRELSIAAARLFHEKPTKSVDIPLVGISWGEATAIARFAGGRLAFECEWEVAMQRSSRRPIDKDDSSRDSVIAKCWQHAPQSDWGCVIATNVLQEWTADVFSPVYWRADSNLQGKTWTPGQMYGVSLRGSCLSDIYKDHRFRRSVDPDDGHPARGFRRVWDREPSSIQCSSQFVLH